MPEETLLAFDYGTKKIGIAIGNTLTLQARPLEIIHSEIRDVRFGRIAALLVEWQPQRLVVGLALDADGGEQEATGRCRRFANQLHGRYGLPVVLVDERGSSMQAQALLGTHEADDAMAAAVILQRYLDSLSA
jgi:putative Holliday junction resolvase